MRSKTPFDHRTNTPHRWLSPTLRPRSSASHLSFASHSLKRRSRIACIRSRSPDAENPVFPTSACTLPQIAHRAAGTVDLITAGTLSILPLLLTSPVMPSSSQLIIHAWWKACLHPLISRITEYEARRERDCWTWTSSASMSAGW